MKKYIVLILTMILIVSCGEKARDNKTDLVVNVSSEPKTIDPSITGNDFIYARHVFEGLITKDENGVLVGGVAKDWDISPDGLTYTFNLRDNSKWSDGKPVTAHDFEYGIKRAANPESGAEYTTFVEYIKNAREVLEGKMPVDSLGVRAIDDLTLEIQIVNPTGYFADLLTYPVFFPVRRDIIEADPSKWSLSPDTYIGNGAFVLTERVMDDKMVMVKSDTYWDKEKIKLNQITFILSRDQNLAIAGIKEGSIDFSNNPSEQDVPKLMKEGLVYTVPYFGTFAFNINGTNEFLKNPKVRKALSLTIDRNFIVEKVAMSGQTAAAAWVPMGAPDVEGDFRENGGDYLDIDPNNYEKNIEEAKKLLAEAGYPNGENTPLIEFTTSTYLPYIQVAEAIQQMWKEHLNIDLRVVIVEWAVYQDARRDGTFQMARNGWIGDYNDPMTFLENYVSSSPQNYWNYSNKAYDELIAFAKETTDFSKRMEAMHKAEEILITGDDSVIIPIHYSAIAVLANPKLKNVLVSNLGDTRFHYAYME